MKSRSEIRKSRLATALAWLAAIAVISLLGPASARAQCSLCRDAVASSSAETREAMNYAIIGLALTPYAVAAAAAWALSPAVRAYVRAGFRRFTARSPGESL